MSVTTIRPGITLEGEPNLNAIENLQDMLKRAEKGEIVALGIVAVSDDDTVTTCFVDDKKRFCLLGGIEYLRYRLSKAIDG